MGASILPVTIHNGKLLFLFGKERNIDDTPGWSDFGGGTDKGETFMQTAIREGGEELTGFLGNNNDIRHMLNKYGTYNIDYNANNGHVTYRCHIFPMKYETFLPHYYNNNQRFLQKNLDPAIIKKSKIFEKCEIKWFSVYDIKKNIKGFRSFYQNIVKIILNQKNNIETFTKTSLKSNTTRKKYQKNNKSRKNN